MRLNGRREIMAYLGRSVRNKRSWRKIRARYAGVIWCEPGSGHCWADSADLDAIDRKRCVSMAEFLPRRPKGEPVGDGMGSLPPEFQKLVHDLYPGGVRKKRT